MKEFGIAPPYIVFGSAITIFVIFIALVTLCYTAEIPFGAKIGRFSVSRWFGLAFGLNSGLIFSVLYAIFFDNLYKVSGSPIVLVKCLMFLVSVVFSVLIYLVYDAIKIILNFARKEY